MSKKSIVNIVIFLLSAGLAAGAGAWATGCESERVVAKLVGQNREIRAKNDQLVTTIRASRAELDQYRAEIVRLEAEIADSRERADKIGEILTNSIGDLQVRDSEIREIIEIIARGRQTVRGSRQEARGAGADIRAALEIIENTAD